MFRGYLVKIFWLILKQKLVSIESLGTSQYSYQNEVRYKYGYYRPLLLRPLKNINISNNISKDVKSVSDFLQASQSPDFPKHSKLFYKQCKQVHVEESWTIFKSLAKICDQ